MLRIGSTFVVVDVMMVGLGNDIDIEGPKMEVGGGDALISLVVSITIPNESLFGVGCANCVPPCLGNLGPTTRELVPFRSADFDRERTVFGRAGGGDSGGRGTTVRVPPEF